MDVDLGITTGLSFSTLYGDDVREVVNIGGRNFFDWDDYNPSEYSLTKRVGIKSCVYLNLKANNVIDVRLLSIGVSLRGGGLNKNYADSSIIDQDTFICDYDAEYEVKLNYLDLSAMALEFKFPTFKRFTPFLLIGPQFSILLQSKKKVNYTVNRLEGPDPYSVQLKKNQLGETYEYDLEDHLDEVDISIILSYGLKMKAGKGNILLHFNHLFGTGSITDKYYNSYYKYLLIKSRSFSFSAGYEFYFKGKEKCLYPNNKPGYRKKRL